MDQYESDSIFQSAICININMGSVGSEEDCFHDVILKKDHERSQ